MSLLAKCPRCDTFAHEGPCLMENPEKAIIHDSMMTAWEEVTRLRAEIERLNALLEASGKTIIDMTNWVAEHDAVVSIAREIDKAGLNVHELPALLAKLRGALESSPG